MTAPTLTEVTPVRTHQDMIGEAGAIIAEVREAWWPPNREAQQAIGWAYSRAEEARAEYSAVLNGDLDPLDVGAPDMGFWEDPERQAREYTAYEALQAAEAASKRLDEYTRREAGAIAQDGGSNERDR